MGIEEEIKLPKILIQSHMITEIEKKKIELESEFKNDCINSGVCTLKDAEKLLAMIEEASYCCTIGYVNIMKDVRYILFDVRLPFRRYSAMSYLKKIIKGNLEVDVG